MAGLTTGAPEPASLRSGLSTVAAGAAGIGIAGLIAGAAAGWISVAAGGGVGRAASIGAAAFLALPVLVPLLLIAVTATTVDEPAMRPWYASMPRALGLELLMGAGGTVASGLLFLLPAAYLPVILRRYDAASMIVALRSRIGWDRFLLTLAVTLAVAAFAAIVSSRSARE